MDSVATVLGLLSLVTLLSVAAKRISIPYPTWMVLCGLGIALFLPFFIGQVVRAYGWLIILGNQGMVNEALGLVGVPPMRLLYNYPAVLFGLVHLVIFAVYIFFVLVP